MNLILAIAIALGTLYALAHLAAFWRVCERGWKRAQGTALPHGGQE